MEEQLKSLGFVQQPNDTPLVIISCPTENGTVTYTAQVDTREYEISTFMKRVGEALGGYPIYYQEDLYNPVPYLSGWFADTEFKFVIAQHPDEQVYEETE